MSSKRPDRLHYTGKHGEFFVGVPRRNLTERDIARLSDEQLADITAENPATGKALYVAPKAKPEQKPKAEPKAEEPKAEAKAE